MMQILVQDKYVHGTTYKFNVYGSRIENKSTYIGLLFCCLYIEIACTIFYFLNTRFQVKFVSERVPRAVRIHINII